MLFTNRMLEFILNFIDYSLSEANEIFMFGINVGKLYVNEQHDLKQQTYIKWGEINHQRKIIQ